MKLLSFIILMLMFSVILSKGQKKPKGRTSTISGEIIEIKIPVKNKPEQVRTQTEEIKQVQNSIKSELKDYTLEMQNQRFISDNVITEVNVGVLNVNGKQALKVTYSYTLKNDTNKFQTDDFGPGKYLLNESNALQVTLAVLKKNIEGKLAKYISPTKEISITVNGSADAVPFKRAMQYKGEFGEQIREVCDFEGKTTEMLVAKSKGISDNPTLAFLRSYTVRDYLNEKIFHQKYANLKYHHSASVSDKRGGQFRRVFVELLIYSAFE